MKKRLFLAVALLLVPHGLSGQGDANCHGVLTSSLASGHEHRALDTCVTQMIPEVARAIRNAGSDAETARLMLLHRLAYRLRDPAIFTAGLDLAKQSGTAPAARVLGLYIALTQVHPDIGFTTRGVSRPFRVPLAEHCEETSFTTDGTEGFSPDNGLPTGAEAILQSVAAGLVTKDGEPLMVRRFAKCVLLVLPGDDSDDA
jgi:hypothetical protein